MRDLAGTSTLGSIDDQGGGGGKRRVAGGVVAHGTCVCALFFKRKCLCSGGGLVGWTSRMACYLEARSVSLLDANGRSDVCDCRHTSLRPT
jgi:hypothetical protein